jgi:hypothetical protein
MRIQWFFAIEERNDSGLCAAGERGDRDSLAQRSEIVKRVGHVFCLLASRYDTVAVEEPWQLFLMCASQRKDRLHDALSAIAACACLHVAMARMGRRRLVKGKRWVVKCVNRFTVHIHAHTRKHTRKHTRIHARRDKTENQQQQYATTISTFLNQQH